MEAAIRRRIARAPPPTPIATGKGRRSAAVDDRVLTQYLETSLRVPDLALPNLYPSKSPVPKTQTRILTLSSLAAGEDAYVGEMMTAAGEIGAFEVDAGDLVAREEVMALIDAGREMVGGGEEKEMVLDEGAEAYRIFSNKRDYSSSHGMWFLREKMEKVTSKLEMVAESIAKVISEHVKNQSHSSKLQKVHSVVCLRRYGDSYKSSENAALSLHVTGSVHKFCVHSPHSMSFTLPSGCILVTIGKQFKEFCNGELKGFDGEISLDPSSDQLAPFSLEFMYSLPVLNHVPSHSLSKTVSMMDQLLILLILVLLYNMWS